MNTAALPRLLLTPGEPAGIGPDLVVAVAQQPLDAALAAVCDPALLQARAQQLGLPLQLRILDRSSPLQPHRPGELQVLPVPLAAPVQAGRLDPRNAAYVLDTLRLAARQVLAGAADALVTAPVHKGVINDAGVAFTGHTEFLAELCGAPTPVMMLVAGGPDTVPSRSEVGAGGAAGAGLQPSPVDRHIAGVLRVALATTHLPLREVPDAITREGLESVLRVLHHDLRSRFGLSRPRILVCGLNPHSGEGGHLGREEIEVIAPVLERLRAEGMQLSGPLPADTLFTPRLLAQADAVLAMYHDQGLPVLKYAGFGEAVNVTLGLPIIRTSVDHGTALDLAGSGRAESGSLHAALRMALELVRSAARIPT